MRLPPKAPDRLALADWLELVAITGRRRLSSPADLERALQREAIFPDRGDLIEQKLADVVAELEARSRSAGNGYPFDLAGGVLTVRPDAWTTRSTYLFCLGLTNYGNRPDGRGAFPARIFEFVSTGAAGNFLGGEGVRFGSPRHVRELPPAFAAAVEAVSVRLGEGGGFSNRPTHWTKDWGVDLVAWRPLPDHLPGQLVLFGGCASGKDWDEKLSECNPGVWCKAWMRLQPESQILKAFFIPRRLDGADSWTLMSYQAGIIFDRCRLAHWLPALPQASHHGRGIRWTKAAFRDLASRN